MIKTSKIEDVDTTKEKWLNKIYSNIPVLVLIVFVINMVLFLFNLIPNPPVQEEIFFELSYRLIEVLGIMLVILIPFCTYSFQKISSDWEEHISLSSKLVETVHYEIKKAIKKGEKLTKEMESSLRQIHDKFEFLRGFKGGTIDSLIRSLVMTLLIGFFSIGAILIILISNTVNTIINFEDLVVISSLFFLGISGFFVFLQSITKSMRIFHESYSSLRKGLSEIEIMRLKELEKNYAKDENIFES